MRRKPSDLLISILSVMNFAKIMLSEPAARKSRSSILSAAAQTISEVGMPGLIVRSQEPKQFHTTLGNEQEWTSLSLVDI